MLAFISYQFKSCVGTALQLNLDDAGSSICCVQVEWQGGGIIKTEGMSKWRPILTQRAEYLFVEAEKIVESSPWLIYLDFENKAFSSCQSFPDVDDLVALYAIASLSPP